MIKTRIALNLFRLSAFRFARFDPRINYYSELGISETAGEEEIKKGFRKKALKLHPDRNEGVETEDYKRITAAYTVLSDSATRAEYDAARGGRQEKRTSGFKENYYHRNRAYYSNFKEGESQNTYESNYREQGEAVDGKQVLIFCFLFGFVITMFTSRFGGRRQHTPVEKEQPEQPNYYRE